VAIFPKF